MNALAYVDRMPAVVCHACGWWQYDVPTDTPRGGNRPPVHCPECIKHHGARRTPTPVWVRFEERAKPDDHTTYGGQTLDRIARAVYR